MNFRNCAIWLVVLSACVLFAFPSYAEPEGSCCNTTSDACTGVVSILIEIDGNTYRTYVDVGTNSLWVCGANNYDDGCEDGDVHCATVGPGVISLLDEDGNDTGATVTIGAGNALAIKKTGCGTGEGYCD